MTLKKIKFSATSNLKGFPSEEEGDGTAASVGKEKEQRRESLDEGRVPVARKKTSKGERREKKMREFPLPIIPDRRRRRKVRWESKGIGRTKKEKRGGWKRVKIVGNGIASQEQKAGNPDQAIHQYRHALNDLSWAIEKNTGMGRE